MKIGELASCLPKAELRGDSHVEIKGIAYDSRQVRPGDLFVCIKGFRFDGHGFIDDAMARGVAGLIVDKRSLQRDHDGIIQGSIPGIGSIPIIYTEDSRQALALVGAHFYDYPSQKLRLIGITGTNGKTTTTYLIKSILETAGWKVGLIGTIQNMIGDTVLAAEHTTPESVDLQYLLSRMVASGCDFVVMEVSSHALKLQRTTGSEFDIGVFTNLSQDHLDFHTSFQDYLDTKTGFFADLGQMVTKEAKMAVLNLDDDYVDYISKRVNVPIMTYGTKENATYRAHDIVIEPSGLTYRLEHAGGEAKISLPITGYFNVYNSLAALSACLAAGVSLAMTIKGLREARPVPGRLEPVDQGQDFTVLVDYAHTPDGLENVLKTVNGLTQGRNIVVFGCGGDRDRTKRPLMGEIAGKMADMVIVTSDNPRSEVPASICEEVSIGVKKTIGDKPWKVIIDRRQAIFRAIDMARPGDVVLIAGKGHETYQILKDYTIHFDDREEATRALKARLDTK